MKLISKLKKKVNKFLEKHFDDKQQHDIKVATKTFLTFIKWTVIAIFVGFLVGGISIAFGKCLNAVTEFRNDNVEIVIFLPIAGMSIVKLYKSSHYENNSGTNIVLSNLHAREDIPFRTAPLIFVSTIITHLFGGSAGREGAALQLGGSIGNEMGKVLQMDDYDRRVVVMSGMSAAFSALFGTPMAAAIFSIEVGSIGIMHYAALVPCVFASVVASKFAVNLGIRPENFDVFDVPSLTLFNSGKVVIMSILFALVSMLFCIVLHRVGAYMKNRFKNSYIRILVASFIILGGALVLKSTDYMGAGIEVINKAMEGDVKPYTFLLKILFTAVTLGGGFKGGEIVPSFFVGATLGSVLGDIFGLPVAFSAALGMTAVFCGATNCPIASILISFELFGYSGAVFFMMTVAISYMLSGYFGLYGEQKIMYSKTRTQYINKSTTNTF